MVWSANIEKVIQDPDAIVVEIVYTDGIQKIQKEIRLTSYDLNNFKRLVQSQIAQLTTTDFSKIKIDLPLGPFDPAITPPPDPTSEELARTKFTKDLMNLRQLKNALELGFVNQQAIDDKFNAMQSAYLDSYIDIFDIF